MKAHKKREGLSCSVVTKKPCSKHRHIHICNECSNLREWRGAALILNTNIIKKFIIIQTLMGYWVLVTLRIKEGPPDDEKMVVVAGI